MNSKKKYLGKLSLFCGLLFCLLFVLSFGSCFASFDDDFTQTEVDQINTFFSYDLTVSDVNNGYSSLKTQYPSINKRNIMFLMNVSFNSPYYSALYMLVNNGSFGTIPYVYLKATSDDYTFYQSTSADNYSSNNYYYLNIKKRNGLDTFNNKLSFYSFNYTPAPVVNDSIFDWKYLLTTMPTQSFYYKAPGQSVAIPVMSKNYIILDDYIPPQEPSGDNGSGDISSSGGLGNITNPSGDNGGNINLQPIQQGLTNIQNQISGDIQRVIDIQNQNIQATISAINNANSNYWGSGDDLDGDKQQDDISDNFNNIINSLSGDLSQNETFTAIENIENGFFDLFRNQQTETVYDLAFEWDNFEYNGVVLIPAGSINISQMCRDNVQLGYIQGIIRVVFNFEVAITLIYQIWNLILATLGIDNPYLYENYNAVEKLNLDSGEVHSYTYRRRRFLKK